MKNKQIFLAILFLAIVTVTAYSQQGQMHPRNTERLEIKKRLNLSDTQREQIQKLRTEFQKQQITHRSKVQLANIELRELIRAENPDKSAIEKKIQEASQLRAQQQMSRVNHMLAMRNVLTSEQQKIMREELRGRFHDRLRQRRFERRGFNGRFRGHGMRGEVLPRQGLGNDLMFGLGFGTLMDIPDDELEVDDNE